MLGTGSVRNLRENASKELTKLREFNWIGYFSTVMDGVIRGITAGFSLAELRAILRGDPPTERPNPRYKAQVKSFMLHLRPKYYQRGSTWFTHTWRLGWFSVYFFIVETITGIILMLFYAPTPERAYADMLFLLGEVPFGKFMRDMHRLGAEGMVAVVVLHMVRVYFTGSYKAERAFTWFTGVILLLVTLVLSFSGYLLPWDQLAYWAVTIGTSMAESAPLFGNEVNLLFRGAVDIWEDGLMRFYLLHVLLLPLVAIIFISVHYYKVAREHSISLPAVIEEGDMDKDARQHAEERIDLIPTLMIHELMLTSVATFILVISVATFFEAPLEAHANPQVTPLHTEAPWYFLWLQGMLKLGDKTLMGVVLPTLIFAVLFVVPWLDKNPHRLASKRPAAIAMGLLSTVIMIILTYMGTPGYAIETPPAQDIISHFVPATHPGPIKALPWDGVMAGPYDEERGVDSKRTYFVSYPESFTNAEEYPEYRDTDRYLFIQSVSGPVKDLDGEEIEMSSEEMAFIEVLREFKSEVEKAAKLIPPVDDSAALAMVTVEEVQPGHKWLEMTITWDEIATDDNGEPMEVPEGMYEDYPNEGKFLLKRELKPRPDPGPVPDIQKSGIGLHKDSNYRGH